MPQIWKSIKKYAIPILLLPCLVGCSTPQEVDKNQVTVCLIDNAHIVARRYVNKAERGGDITFRFTLLEGYEVEDCSYADCTITQKDNDCTVVLHNVRYSCRVSVSCFLPLTEVLYDYNGGSVDGVTSETVSYKKSAHLRVNTSTALNVEREGYVLTGWNTSADGQGEHIGLGSRITAFEEKEMTLYAEWWQESDQADFVYESTDKGINLLSYTGDTDRLVLPTYIEGKPVTAISSGFATDLDLSALVLPSTMDRIDSNAFTNCEIQDLYFFDLISEVKDSSFSNQIPHIWHINAWLTPRYMGLSDITIFADKMDMLIMNADKQKLILFAGCSMFYGLDSQILAEAYPSYVVMNMGAVGGTNASFQFDCISHYIKEGDVFVHAPEQASGYQLMQNVDCENRVFIATEGNFDLLMLTDMAKMSGSFDCFSAFNANRKKLELSSYQDAFEFNEYCDNTSNRPNIKNDKRLTENYGVLDYLVTDESMSRLCDYYDLIEGQGGKVYVSYAPINELCVIEENKLAFVEKMKAGLDKRGYEIISNFDDYIMPADYFHDTDYHLTNESAIVRTKLLLNDLKKVL